MGVSVLFALHGINTPSNFYAQLENAQLQLGAQILTVQPSGHTQPLFRAVQSQVPTIEFGTPDVATILDECGLDGVDTSAGNVDLYEVAVSNLGTRVAPATTSHNRYRVAESLFYVASIDAPHNGVAMASGRIMPNYDGTNEPVVPTGSVALAGTGQPSSHFGAGPVEIAGAALTGVERIQIEFGVELFQVGASSELWPSFTAIARIVPRILITTVTTPAIASYGIDGTAISGDGVELWLRKYQADGSRVSNATAEHIKLTVTDGIIVPETLSTSGNAPNQVTLAIYPRADDTTDDALDIDTAAAIA